MGQVPRPAENQFAGQHVEHYVLEEEVGGGNFGVVYRSRHEDLQEEMAACKLIPIGNLAPGWDMELRKAGRLSGVRQAVEYKFHRRVSLDGIEYLAIFWQWIGGPNLRKYAQQHGELITLSFVELLTKELLEFFIAMDEVGISHDDLHDGNVLIAYDPRLPEPEVPQIKVTDYGLGGSLKGARQKDDYVQLAVVCRNLLADHIDPAELDAEDAFVHDGFVDDFLRKRVLERDPTVGTFVRSPRELRQMLLGIRPEYREQKDPGLAVELANPFDYLRCEQIGNSFGLLQTLYSRDFPGYGDLMQRTNTVLTGPRGCGKTTIFRNLSLKVQLLAHSRALDSLESFVGVYYHCNDLFFAFPYSRSDTDETEERAIAHYFNLSLLHEVLDTLVVASQIGPAPWAEPAGRALEEFISSWMPSYHAPPQGSSILHHLRSFVERLRHAFRMWVADDDPTETAAEHFLPLDFIARACSVLQDAVPWLRERPLYFLLDDYSLPRVSPIIQRSLNDFIFLGYPNCFFKIATESITSLYPLGSSGKLIEETREYDIIDLGSQFLHVGHAARKLFLAEVIGTRLRESPAVHEDYHDVEQLLGQRPHKSYNELARAIRSQPDDGDDRAGQVLYAGLDTLVDLCSGDVAEILRVMRNIVSAAREHMNLEQAAEEPVLINAELQDRAMREAGAYFLERIEAAEKTGARMRRVVEAFGNVARWVLRNVRSKNESGHPPKQAFRIEVFDPIAFGDGDEAQELREVYGDLIKYAVFIRDVRGKSVRGAVVPRLYLRRILIPTFLLSPSQRDNIGVEVDEFRMLLSDPARFADQYKQRAKERLNSKGVEVSERSLQKELPYEPPDG